MSVMMDFQQFFSLNLKTLEGNGINSVLTYNFIHLPFSIHYFKMLSVSPVSTCFACGTTVTSSCQLVLSLWNRITETLALLLEIQHNVNVWRCLVYVMELHSRKNIVYVVYGMKLSKSIFRA